MKTKTNQTIRKVTRSLAAVLALATAPAVFAASQVWTNAPVDGSWINTNNWIARGIPGALNQTGNSVNNDVVTFNAPIPGSNIGSVGNPILVDDATVVGARGRVIGGITFDTPNCGKYAISSLSAPLLPGAGVLYVSHNGSIQMTAGVTNSQVITMPLYVRLPSSTAGIYNLINNSTNAVTMYIGGITNDSANTRGTDFRLGGSNTGTNTVEAISAGTTTSGGNGFTKQGAGTWVLTGVNDFRSQTVVSILEGLLIAKDPAAFGAATTATITNTGILQVDGVTINQFAFNLNKGGTIRMNGTGGVNGVNVGAHAGTSATLATTSSSDVFNVGTSAAGNSIVAGGAADTVLHTAGPGTIVLATVNTYAGNWSFDAATNQLQNFSLTGARNVNVAAGAILDVSPLGYYSLGSLTFSAGGFGTTVGSSAATVTAGAGGTFDLGSKSITLAFTPATFSGDTTHPSLFVSEGSIALNGNFFTINNTSGTPLGVGTYRLIQQATGSVSVSGGPFAVVLGSGLAPGTIGDIVVSGGNVNLVVSTHVPASLSWKGGNPDNVWDSLTTANWNDGIGFAQFGNGDSVAFNALGSANPIVSIAGTMLPASVTVDTSANNYTLTGVGQIAGPSSLVKVGAGTLTLETANAYLGGTTISNGTVRVGIANAIPSAGTGNVAVYGTGAIDLNGFNNSINGLNGDGSVDNSSGTAAVLTLGNNNANSVFTGAIKSTTGSVAVTKLGTGSLTLTASNSYSGASTVNAGTVNIGNARALGAGDLVVNAGTVNLQTGLQLNSLAGTGGLIANNASAATNNVLITGTNNTTFGGSVVDGSGGGGVSLTLLGGTLTMSGNNTYSGGTYLGSGAQFAIPNSPAAVGGFVIASNNSTLYLSGGSGTPGTPNSVTTVAGAKVTFASGAEGKIWNAQFIGSVNSTNRFIGPVSAGQSMSFSNFLGVVEIANTNEANQNFRFFNGGGSSGGENTLFVLERGNIHTRDAQTVKLGALVGGSASAGIGGASTAGAIDTYEIGAKNLSAAFHGYISGSNNIVKTGTGTLTLDGVGATTNLVTLPDPNEPTNIVSYVLAGSLISYQGATTVSNGVLKIVAPNNLTNSPSITLAGGTLDATQIGYGVNQTTIDFNSVEQITNIVSVTTGVLEILDGQSLNGTGSILGSVTTVPNTTLNVGQGIGTLAVSGSVSLNGTVNMELNRSNPGQNSDRLTAASFSGSGATLNITNAGPTLFSGTTFQLFNHGVSAFTTVNLPATDASGQLAYTWDTSDLTVGGSVTLVSGGLSATPTPITSVVSGGNLQMSWPADHTGWTLQAQTNALNVGITGAWFDVGGSTTTNQVFVPISAANPTVFYRLVLPLP